MRGLSLDVTMSPDFCPKEMDRGVGKHLYFPSYLPTVVTVKVGRNSAGVHLCHKLQGQVSCPNSRAGQERPSGKGAKNCAWYVDASAVSDGEC